MFGWLVVFPPSTHMGRKILTKGFSANPNNPSTTSIGRKIGNFTTTLGRGCLGEEETRNNEKHKQWSEKPSVIHFWRAVQMVKWNTLCLPYCPMSPFPVFRIPFIRPNRTSHGSSSRAAIARVGLSVGWIMDPFPFLRAMTYNLYHKQWKHEPTQTPSR